MLKLKFKLLVNFNEVVDYNRVKDSLKIPSGIVQGSFLFLFSNYLNLGIPPTY